MKKSRIIHLGIRFALLAVILLSAAGCATTREAQRTRNYQQQQRAAERICEALVDFIIESI